MLTATIPIEAEEAGGVHTDAAVQGRSRPAAAYRVAALDESGTLLAAAVRVQPPRQQAAATAS